MQSARGIGKEGAFSLAEAGANVVVFADMNEESAKTSSEESVKYASNRDYQTTIFKMNVQDAESVEAMVDFVVKNYGRLDYCVNAAGVSFEQCWTSTVEANTPGILYRLIMAFMHP
jgi:NAD(P)-dependent dehydrogenase (short-subunit alcohol dehydrogenase family)